MADNTFSSIGDFSIYTDSKDENRRSPGQSLTRASFLGSSLAQGVNFSFSEPLFADQALNSRVIENDAKTNEEPSHGLSVVGRKPFDPVIFDAPTILTLQENVAVSYLATGTGGYAYSLHFGSNVHDNQVSYGFHRHVRPKKERFIPQRKTDGPSEDYSDRIRLLYGLTEHASASEIRSHIERLFPNDLVHERGHGLTPPLLESAPALWASAKEPGDTPPVFIKRHYAPWLGNGLARPDIKRLDPQLYVALSNWLRHNEMPADLDLPTLKERNDQWVSRVAQGDELPPSDPGALARLALAAQRRQATQMTRAPEELPPPPPLPETAPALWASAKEPGDTPPVFIQRHYGPWLGNGLVRPDIKRLDPQLYVALSNWLRRNEMPADLDLPTLKERNDRWVSRVAQGGEAEAALREARRLVRTAERR